MAAIDRKQALESSTEMAPVQGSVEVDVPIAELWRAFTHANWWPRWNKCFFWVHNRELILGRTLIWAFQPIRWYYLYKMFAVARIVELEPQRKVTWEVTALPGFYARHTYHMEDLGGGRTSFGSWEQAMGAQIRFALTRRFWVAHFTFVKDESLAGARALESIYRKRGGIVPENLPVRRGWRSRLVAALVVLLVVCLGFATWFYRSYVSFSVVTVTPGVTVVMGGGGNSTVIEDGGQLLLIDTKFPPGSTMLRRLIANRFHVPVSAIVNTHYHYDHTYGNVEYPGTRIYAYRNVPQLMLQHDRGFWRKHHDAIPRALLGDRTILSVGSQQLLLQHPGPAHTAGDLYVFLRRGGKDIVITGDLVFNGYYPMMDVSGGGMSLDGLIAVVTKLARQYPDAVFIPGHGSLARAADLRNYADYLRSIRRMVAGARQSGLSEDGAVKTLDLSAWHLKILPSVHDYQLCWSTAAMDVRWIYQLETGVWIGSEDCKF